MTSLDPYKAVDPDWPVWKAVTEGLQGNIVKSHGRDFSALILFDLSHRGNGPAGIRDLARRYVTSADEQAKQAAVFRANRDRDATLVDRQVFGGLYLSAWGYRHLGFSEERLARAFPDPENQRTPNWFLTGMEYQGSYLMDPPPSQWEDAYRESRLDAILLLACDAPTVLDKAVSDAEAEIKAFARIIKVERSVTLRDKNERPLEHFGFVDGISQPSIMAGSMSAVRSGCLLVPDSLAGSEHTYGSYLVYRKLEQDVTGFEAAVAELARAAQVSPAGAGAMIVGRFKDGTPLTDARGPLGANGQPPVEIDFKAHGDLEGRVCPLHAHIRKANPRNWPASGDPISSELFRRGVPYGIQGSGQPVGMLFMAFQADIARQFGRMTVRWMHGADFPRSEVGPDALLANGKPVKQRWPGDRLGGKEVEFTMQRFITLRGGEFFFAPSLAFFDALA